MSGVHCAKWTYRITLESRRSRKKQNGYEHKLYVICVFSKFWRVIGAIRVVHHPPLLNHLLSPLNTNHQHPYVISNFNFPDDVSCKFILSSLYVKYFMMLM